MALANTMKGTKQIDFHHFNREKILSKEIELNYCPAEEMTAEIPRKNLPTALFCKNRDGLGVRLASSNVTLRASVGD
jgi:hypothetical protein